MFDINDEKKSMKTINFTNEATKERKIQISLTSNQIIFTNCDENFILTNVKEEGKEFTVQRNLPQIDQQVVKLIKPYESGCGFYTVGSKNYDNFIDIQTSQFKQFPARI